MPIEIEIDRADRRAFERFARRFPMRVDKAERAAINRSLTSGRQVASVEAREEIALKARSVKSRMKLHRPRMKAEGTIEVRRKLPNLASFRGARQRKKNGVIVQVRKNKPKEVHRHAFIQSPRGKKLVFQRRVVGGKRVGRYPIDPVVGPGPQGVIEHNPRVRARTEKRIIETLENNMANQMERVLEGK